MKTQRQTFFITCLSTKRDRLYVVEINENGEVVNQAGITDDGKYLYEVSASCVDPDGGLLIGLRRRTSDKLSVTSSTIVHFDAGLQLRANYLINSRYGNYKLTICSKKVSII